MPHFKGYHDFSGGAYTDLPGYLIPQNGVYEAWDMLADKPGKLRKRGGTQAPGTATATATLAALGILDSGAIDDLTRFYGVTPGGNAYSYINESTGALTAGASLTSGSSNTSFTPRPFQHLNTLVMLQNGYANIHAVGGAIDVVGKPAYTLSGTCSVTADNPLLTFSASQSGLVEVGGFLFMPQKGLYRIARIVSTTTVEVDPTPESTSGTISSCKYSPVVTPAFLGLTSSNIQYGAKYGVSYQNRIVLASIFKGYTATSTMRFANRVMWTILPDEDKSGEANPLDGYNQLNSKYIEKFNFFDVPSREPIQGLAAVGDNQLLVFGINKIFRLQGFLDTVTSTSTGITVDLKGLPAGVGLVSDRSIQYSSRGLIFASYDGVYVYDGVMRPIMHGRVANTFRDEIRTVTVYGSAIIGGTHYLLSTSGGGWLVNLETLAWTRTTGVNPMDSSPDPSDATKCWGLRWWDVGTTAPTHTNGSLIRLDTILRPSSTNRYDSDGSTGVTSRVTTRTYAEDDLETKKILRDTQFTYDARALSSTVTVKAKASLDPSTAYSGGTSLGTLTQTTTPGVKNLPNRQDGLGIAYSIEQAGLADSFELLGIKHGFQERRPGA